MAIKLSAELTARFATLWPDILDQVAAGETLRAISDEHGVSVVSLLRATQVSAGTRSTAAADRPKNGSRFVWVAPLPVDVLLSFRDLSLLFLCGCALARSFDYVACQIH